MPSPTGREGKPETRPLQACPGRGVLWAVSNDFIIVSEAISQNPRHTHFLKSKFKKMHSSRKEQNDSGLSTALALLTGVTYTSEAETRLTGIIGVHFQLLVPETEGSSRRVAQCGAASPSQSQPVPAPGHTQGPHLSEKGCSPHPPFPHTHKGPRKEATLKSAKRWPGKFRPCPNSQNL